MNHRVHMNTPATAKSPWFVGADAHRADSTDVQAIFAEVRAP